MTEPAATLVDLGLRPGATVAILLGYPPRAPDDPARALLYEVAVHEQRDRDIVDRLGIPAFCVGPGGAGPDIRAPRANRATGTSA